MIKCYLFNILTISLLLSFSKIGIAYNTESKTPVALRPNVLLLLDNTRSMSRPILSQIEDTPITTRLAALKQAVTNTIKQQPNINFGLMQFNSPGGAITYPVKALDQNTHYHQLTNTQTLEQTHTYELQGFLTSSTETTSIHLKQMIEEEQTLTRSPVWQQVQQEFSHNAGWIQQLMHSTNTQKAWALQANQLTLIPFLPLKLSQQSNINEVYWEIKAPTNTDQSLTIELTLVDLGPTNASTVDTNITLQTLFNKTKTTQQSITWVLPAWKKGKKHRSPNLATLLNHVLKSPSWHKDNKIGLLIKTDETAQKRELTHAVTEKISKKSLKLNIKYHSYALHTEPKVQLWFDQVPLDPKARIKTAFLTFSSHSPPHHPIDLNIALENNIRPTPFTTQFDLQTRPILDNIEHWRLTPSSYQNQTFRSVNLASLFNAFLKKQQHYWCAHNPLAIYVLPQKAKDFLQLEHTFIHNNLRAVRLSITTYPKPDHTINHSKQTTCHSTLFASKPHQLSTEEKQSPSSLSWQFPKLPLKAQHKIQRAYMTLPVQHANTNMSSTLIPTITMTTHTQSAASQPQHSMPDNQTPLQTWPTTLENGRQAIAYDLSETIQSMLNSDYWQPGNNITIEFNLHKDSQQTNLNTLPFATELAKLIIQAPNKTFDSNIRYKTRDALLQKIHSLKANTRGSITDALLEAALYYNGNYVFFGKNREIFELPSGPVDPRFNRVSHVGSLQTGKLFRPTGCSLFSLDNIFCRAERLQNRPRYRSPIQSACQSNHIIIITDSLAQINHSQKIIGTLIKNPHCYQDSLSLGEQCARSLTGWLSKHFSISAQNTRVQPIQTHTIAFNLNDIEAIGFLKTLAEKGNGIFQYADSSATLNQALSQIYQKINQENQHTLQSTYCKASQQMTSKEIGTTLNIGS